LMDRYPYKHHLHRTPLASTFHASFRDLEHDFSRYLVHAV
jgi:hypothetical protein